MGTLPLVRILLTIVLLAAAPAFGAETATPPGDGGVLTIATPGGFALEMVPVPGGSFDMGDTFGEGTEAERPVHRVALKSFLVGKTEVTQRQWVAVMGGNPSCFRGEDLPVEGVSWDDCQIFLARLNQMTGRRFRLPTEAEWEYAARSAGKKERYSGSDSLDPVAWYDLNSGGQTHPVGTKAANGLGIHDMSGNVWEWCSDWYDGGYYAVSPAENPRGPEQGALRVLRGGGWGGEADYDRCSHRDDAVPGDPWARYPYLGFRLASDAE